MKTKGWFTQTKGSFKKTKGWFTQTKGSFK